MAQTLEETFLTTYLKALKEVEDRETKFIVAVVTSDEELALHNKRVGYLCAIEEVKVIFEETKRKYFPEYRS
jgi:hypothetical protein